MQRSKKKEKSKEKKISYNNIKLGIKQIKTGIYSFFVMTFNR